MKMINKTQEELIKDIIEFGNEIEMLEYNNGKFGLYGHPRVARMQVCRRGAKLRINELTNRNIDVHSIKNEDLEYALQFI